MLILWNTNLVVLSIVVAALGSFTTLSYAGRMRASTGQLAKIWLIAGGITLGMTIWSMHFIGMLAMHLSVPLAYDGALTLLSVFPAIAAALLGFYLLQSTSIKLRQVLVGGFFMGLGIAVMHYTGMAALKMQPAIDYHPWIFVASVIIAVTASIGALLVVYGGERTGWPPLAQYGLGALIMAFAITGMHYTAMAGAIFAPGSICTVAGSQVDPNLLAMMVTAGVLVLFGCGWVSHLFERNLVLKQLRIANKRLELSDKELRIAISAFEVQEGVVIADAEKNILRINKAFTRLTGYSAEEIVGQPLAILKSGTHNEKFYQIMRETLEREKYWAGEIWDKRKDGSIYPNWLTVNVVTNAEGEVTNYVAAFSDMSKFKEAQDDIHRLAFYDALTSLPNRRLLQDSLKRAMSASDRNKHYGAILFLDLDNFKTLNDTRGHDFGDLMLIEVALRLQNCMRENDTVARLGGDEFVVMLEDLSVAAEQAAAQAKLAGEKICEVIGLPYILNGQEHHSSASIGVALFCGNEVPMDDLLRHADTAMYQSKLSGRNMLNFFDPSMQAAVESRAELEASLRQALTQQQLQLYYQIQVNGDYRPIGAEVLLRWGHPDGIMIAPSQFIPLAEESGLILPIGHFVLETACKQLKAWEVDPHTSQLSLAVNVSARQFKQPGFVMQVSTLLEETGANPALLKLELTESLVIDIEDAILKMQALKALGVSFSMDDFGTGYSSLASLKRLPLDQLKIDQSFVRDITIDPSDSAIVKTIIGMANTLKLGVIAEGVETSAQLKMLKRLKCPAFQGYLFGQPVPIKEFERMVFKLSESPQAAAEVFSGGSAAAP